jgi:hypothetical protein
MAAALGTHPELIGLPFHVGPGIFQVHLGAAAHAANMNSHVTHKQILTQESGNRVTADRTPWLPAFSITSFQIAQLPNLQSPE